MALEYFADDALVAQSTIFTIDILSSLFLHTALAPEDSNNISYTAVNPF